MRMHRSHRGVHGRLPLTVASLAARAWDRFSLATDTDDAMHGALSGGGSKIDRATHCNRRASTPLFRLYVVCGMRDQPNQTGHMTDVSYASGLGWTNMTMYG